MHVQQCILLNSALTSKAFLVQLGRVRHSGHQNGHGTALVGLRSPCHAVLNMRLFCANKLGEVGERLNTWAPDIAASSRIL